MPLSHYADELQRDFDYFINAEKAKLQKAFPDEEVSSRDYDVFSLLLNLGIVDEDGFHFEFSLTNRETKNRSQHVVHVSQFTVGNRTWKLVDLGISQDYWSNQAILVMELTEGDNEPLLVGFSKANNSWDYSPDKLESFPPVFFLGGWHKLDINDLEEMEENLAQAKKELEMLQRTVHLFNNLGVS